MKTLKNLVAFVIFFNMACAQQSSPSLDGKSFQISTVDVNQPSKQDPDVIVFKNGMLDSEACHQYGFTEAPYKSNISNGEIHFTGTIKSPNEGEIMIEGKVKDNNMNGTMVWTKAGQADIHYTFKGSQKN